MGTTFLQEGKVKMMEGKEAEGFCLRNLFFVGSQFSVGNESGRSGVGT